MPTLHTWVSDGAYTGADAAYTGPDGAYTGPDGAYTGADAPYAPDPLTDHRMNAPITIAATDHARTKTGDWRDHQDKMA